MRRPPEPSERLRRLLDPADRQPEAPDRPAVLTVPAQLTGARWAVSTRAAVGVAVLLGLAVAVLGVRLVLAERAAAPAPVASATPGVTAKGDRAAFASRSSAPASGSPAPGGGAGPSATGKVLVHVVGQVRRPGVVELVAGARVTDAVAAVGGVTKGADLTLVNLARPVVDGEQVVVPREGDDPPVAAASPAPGAPAQPGASAPAAGAGSPPGAQVNLNSADQTTLETLPGVGPVLAERIIEWRTTNGRFTTVEELSEVSGIGDKIYAQIAPKVTV